MKVGVAILIVVALLLLAFVWSRYFYRRNKAKHSPKNTRQGYREDAVEEIDLLFNSEFREELKNIGRLRFENLINRGANSLSEGLDKTVSQLNKQTEEELNNKLTQEIAAYAQAIQQAREAATGSLQKSVVAVEDQEHKLVVALEQKIAEREEALIKAYEANMAQIIEHYLLEALGGQFDLKTQLPFIISTMESNKEAMAEDMRL